MSIPLGEMRDIRSVKEGQATEQIHSTRDHTQINAHC